jgi:hypothetical protein
VAFTLLVYAFLNAVTAYGQEDGETAAPVSPYSARADCIVAHESHWNAAAVNPRSGASGLGQFLRSTWATTPYAARSVFDPYANHAAVCWMLAAGRAREFDVVRLGYC